MKPYLAWVNPDPPQPKQPVPSFEDMLLWLDDRDAWEAKMRAWARLVR